MVDCNWCVCKVGSSRIRRWVGDGCGRSDKWSMASGMEIKVNWNSSLHTYTPPCSVNKVYTVEGLSEGKNCFWCGTKQWQTAPCSASLGCVCSLGSLTTLRSPTNGPWACLEVLAGERSYRIPLTDERYVSIGEGRPLRPSAQLREGRTWSGEGGRGHPPSQPDQPNQPWRSMGWQMSQPDRPHIRSNAATARLYKGQETYASWVTATPPTRKAQRHTPRKHPSLTPDAPGYGVRNSLTVQILWFFSITFSTEKPLRNM